jgi:hypothetical protein
MPKMQIANSFFLEFELDLTQPHITGLSGEGCPNFIKLHRPFLNAYVYVHITWNVSLAIAAFIKRLVTIRMWAFSL